MERVAVLDALNFMAKRYFVRVCRFRTYTAYVVHYLKNAINLVQGVYTRF